MKKKYNELSEEEKNKLKSQLEINTNINKQTNPNDVKAFYFPKKNLNSFTLFLSLNIEEIKKEIKSIDQKKNQKERKRKTVSIK